MTLYEYRYVTKEQRRQNIHVLFKACIVRFITLPQSVLNLIPTNKRYICALCFESPILQSIAFIVSLGMAALLHKKPASVSTFCNGCHAQ